MKNKKIYVLGFSVISIIIAAVAIFSVFASGSHTKTLNIHNSRHGITLQWSDTIGVKSYNVYKTAKDNTFEKIAVVSKGKEKYVDKNVQNGTKYTYFLEAVYFNGKGIKTETESLRYYCATDITRVHIRAASVNITWKKAGTNGYRLYRYSKAYPNGELVYSTKYPDNTFFKDETVVDGESYYYRVLYKNGKTQSALSYKTARFLFLSSPVNVQVKNSPKGVKISWNKKATAKSYKVYCMKNRKWILVATTEKSFAYDTKHYGKKFTYCVRAFCGSKNSSSRGKFLSLYAVNPNKKMVALTYDDGPFSPVTNQLLDLLEKYNGRATFFVVGSRLNTYSDCLKRQNKLGCEIGVHTYNHTMLPYVNKATISREMSDTASLIEKYSGQTPVIARAPGGDVNSYVLENVDYPLINWSVDTLDWKSRNARSVLGIAQGQVYDGAIILMHDLYYSTGNANETLIPWLVKKGYQLVTVSEMMDAKGITLEKHHLYCSAYK